MAVHLTSEDRFYIEKRRAENISMRAIARELERSPSSISRELGRNTPHDFDGLYSSRAADNLAKQRRATASQSKAFKGIDSFVDRYLRQSLANHTSPNVVSSELALKYQTHVSENTLYRYIEYLEDQGESLRKDLPRRGKPYKRSGTVRSTIKNRVDISERPAIVDEKTEIGHVEIDTIVGKNHKSQLLTIVDKASKVVTIRRIKSKSAEAVIEGFKDVHQSTFYEFKTITADNGTEFAGHQEVAKITEADFYFAKPYSSWERGLNEHTNGLIRRFLPKGTYFNDVSDQELSRIEHILNTRGRECLGFYSPYDIFMQHLNAA
uniref:Mobile element protein n=1 Tax=Vibrio tasmaniensis TaxID=212663 RepID=A0A0H3ZKL1_9VIBR|nr:Mobile element protein [Vibrio tasmaniensis]